MKKRISALFLCALSAITLAGCGSEGESVKIYDFNNSITEEEFLEAMDCSLNQKNGYTQEEYLFCNENLNYDGSKSTSKKERTVSTEFDSKNNILYYHQDYSANNSNYGLKVSSEYVNEYQIQPKDESTSYYVNLVNTTYYETKYDAASSTFDSYSIFSVVSKDERYDELDILEEETFTYYHDDDVYTAYVDLKKTKSSSTNGVASAKKSDGFFLFQFYIKDNEAYAVIDFEYESEESKTDGTDTSENEIDYIYKHTVNFQGINPEIKAKSLDSYTDLTPIYSA